MDPFELTESNDDIFSSSSSAPVVPDVSSGDGIVRTFSQCQEWAEQVGCTLRIATDTELFIDIDTEDQYLQCQSMLGWLNGDHQIYHKWVVTPSKSGLPHRHVIATLREPRPLIERITLQAVCGSDPLREAISLKRARTGEENAVIFFEPKSTYQSQPRKLK